MSFKILFFFVPLFIYFFFSFSSVGQNFSRLGLDDTPKKKPAVSAAPKKKKADDDGWDSFELTSAKFVDTSYSSRNDSGGAAAKKEKVTSISSDQYFGRDEEKRQQSSQQHAGRLNQFSGATSISSAQFFDRDEGTTNFGGDDFSSIGDNISQGVKKVRTLFLFIRSIFDIYFFLDIKHCK